MKIKLKNIKYSSISIIFILMLSGCTDIFENKQLKIKEEESFAVGAACREANKAIEDCFSMNPKSYKREILKGWKDMDLYIRENSKK